MKNLVKNFLAGKNFSPQELNQTDFGRIYYNLPSISETPKNSHDLALILKKYHKLGKKVTIRNTGHSLNGQTLTGGIQINVGEIKGIIFDEANLELTAGAGNSWDEVLRAIKFPKYCTVIFPTNPNQEIKIGGTASVGGVGPYSSKRGGFWNHIKKIELVTMTGDIIEASKEKNPDIFYYALGGYGRIGVITKITIPIEKSKQDLLSVLMLYKNPEHYYHFLFKAAHDPAFNGIIAQEQISKLNFWSGMTSHFKSMILITEVGQKESIQEKVNYIKKTYHEYLPLYLKKYPDNNLDVSLEVNKHKKKDWVYFYPEYHKENQLDFCNPWSDYVIPQKHYRAFMREASSIVKKYDLGKYLLHNSIFNNRIDLDIFISYSIKRLSTHNEFPLSLDLDHDIQPFIVGVFPAVPTDKIDKVLAATKYLTDLTYDMDGKRYLYGLHQLSKHQVHTQYGSHIIEKWNEIKDQLDPKHLLNIGVIEHLDD